MSDLPPLPDPVAHRRHWLEYAATGAALVLSAVSLWVAIGTMDAKTKMVQAASWPFLQAATSDSAPDGSRILIFDMVNAGVGPALVETFEVKLDGRPLRTASEMMQRCCGYDPRKPHPVAIHQPGIGSWTEGNLAGTVIRAGESRRLFAYPMTDANARAWTILRDIVAARRLLARACYCSVFGECWQGSSAGLHPTRVDRCVAPAVPYTE